ncbi:MAG TPA: DNA-3-methyladenine glycosylase [Candidatus Saccharimonadales bacterium]|nr:DNA-3-methyladenine glycosylase [Candidatus Saccharimonadales bacterium]
MSDFAFLDGKSTDVAPRLLGCYLVRELDGQRLVGKIVETEAYDQTDAASHSYRGRTPRTDVMFGPSGHVYVYFTYGMHYCMNVVCGPVGHGAAVLIRAIEPLEGENIMSSNRHGIMGPSLTNGPAKLCYALGVDKTMNGHDLHKSPLQLVINPPVPAKSIVHTTRIGITKDAHRPWRFYLKDNLYVSSHRLENARKKA